MLGESESTTNFPRNPIETELELVRAAAASIFDTRALDRVNELAGRANWMQVMWLARQHRLLAVLGEVVASIRDCPGLVRDQLAMFQRANLIIRLLRARELVLLARSFEKARLEVVTLGDWALSEWVYPRAGLSQNRPRLEFLIKAEDRASVERCILDLGYDGCPDRLRLQDDDRSKITLRDDPWPAETAMATRIWERTEYRKLGGSRVRILEPGDWLDLFCARLVRRPRVLLVHAFDVLAVAARTPANGNQDVTARGDHGLWTQASLLASRRLVGLPTSASHGRQMSPETERLERSIRSRCRVARPDSDETVAMPSIADSPEVGSLGPYLPTPPSVVDRMLALAGTTSSDVVYDLGCGDGRVVVAAARNYGARAVGIDSNPRLLAEARANAAGLEELVTLVEADILEADVSHASIVCLYLQGFAYRLIRDRVFRKLRPGTRIVSHDVSFADWPPIRSEIVDTGSSTVAFVFVWQLPGCPA